MEFAALPSPKWRRNFPEIQNCRPGCESLGLETASAVANMRDSAARLLLVLRAATSYSLCLEYLFNSAISADAAAGAFDLPTTIS